MQNKETRLKVTFHDAPFKLQGKTVEAVNLTVKELTIIREEDDEQIVLLNKEISVNILDVEANDPVILSLTNVAPGTYSQLRLVLEKGPTIVVDGETYPLKSPSGLQSGVKLDGPFTIPEGKLFTIDLDFDAQDSIIYNKGQGYILKPVIHITGMGELLGYFRGNLALSDKYGRLETVLALYDDNSYKFKISDYPSYTFTGNYNYQSLIKTLEFSLSDVLGTGLKSRYKRRLMDHLPSKMAILMKQWSLDSMIAFDAMGQEKVLYRVDSFDFSDDIRLVPVKITVNYSDTSMDGKDCMLYLIPLDNGPPRAESAEFSGRSAVVEFDLQASRFAGKDFLEYKARAYVLHDDASAFKLSVANIDGRAAPLLGGSVFKASNMPGPPKIKINKNTVNNLEVNFPPKLNIQMDPPDFSSNTPVFSWDAYPGAQSYYMLVLMKDRDPADGDKDFDGNQLWDVAYSLETEHTQATMYACGLQIADIRDFDGDFYPGLQTGEKFRVQVYALDSSRKLDLATGEGALFSGSRTFIKE